MSLVHTLYHYLLVTMIIISHYMYSHKLVQENLESLNKKGYCISQGYNSFIAIYHNMSRR